MTYKLRRLGNKRKSKQWMEIASRPVSRLKLNLRQFARIPPLSPLNLNILTYLIAPKPLSRLPLKYKQSDLRKLFKFSNSCLVTIFHICLMSKIDIRKFSTTDARRLLDIFLAKIVLFPKIRIIRLGKIFYPFNFQQDKKNILALQSSLWARQNMFHFNQIN